MARHTWLLKTEPETYSFEQMLKEEKVVWDGVANPLALKHLRSMKKGDRAFIYHTGKEKTVVGIADVISDPYPDPKGNNPNVVVVELRGKARLKTPVTLDRIKKTKEFVGFELIRIPRLSVMPVPTGMRNRLLKMAR